MASRRRQAELSVAVALETGPGRSAPRRPRRLSPARVLDLLCIAAVIGGLGWLVIRANAGLDYRWNWSVIPTYLVRIDPKTGSWAPNLLLLGLFTTLRLAIWSLIVGTLIGAVAAAMLVWGRAALRWTARLFVELVRNTPPVVLVFVFYFFVSSRIMPVLGLDRTLRLAPAWAQDAASILVARPERLNDFLSGLACLGLLAGAYITEIIRAGLNSVPNSQIEAARALGMRPFATFRTVVLPPALRNVLPALAGQFIVSIKDSSLVALISIQELTFMTSEVSSTTRRFFEVWLFTALIYFLICFTCSIGFRTLEQRWRRQ